MIAVGFTFYITLVLLQAAGGLGSLAFGIASGTPGLFVLVAAFSLSTLGVCGSASNALCRGPRSLLPSLVRGRDSGSRQQPLSFSKTGDRYAGSG